MNFKWMNCTDYIISCLVQVWCFGALACIVLCFQRLGGFCFTIDSACFVFASIVENACNEMLICCFRLMNVDLPRKKKFLECSTWKSLIFNFIWAYWNVLWVLWKVNKQSNKSLKKLDYCDRKLDIQDERMSASCIICITILTSRVYWTKIRVF